MSMMYANGEAMNAKAQLRALIKKRLGQHLTEHHVAAEILLDLAPSIACLEAGHPQMPSWRLRRYQHTAWRCARCGYWWRTEWRTSYASYPGGDWHWTLARADDPVTYL